MCPFSQLSTTPQQKNIIKSGMTDLMIALLSDRSSGPNYSCKLRTTCTISSAFKKYVYGNVVQKGLCIGNPLFLQLWLLIGGTMTVGVWQPPGHLFRLTETPRLN